MGVFSLARVILLLMSEVPTNPTEEGPDAGRAEKIAELVALAKELSESQETFPFPGIESVAYEKLKEVDAAFPGFATPIDDLLERFKNEGIKVALGPHPENGSVFILPAQSNDIDSDSILPRHLKWDEAMDERLERLVLVAKSNV
jgi:hypothetical protein